MPAPPSIADPIAVSVRPRPGQALYQELKAGIEDGTHAAGTALPSTRALAAERGLARTTVTAVYEQLAAEGFIDHRPGARSRVAAGAAQPLRPARPAKAAPPAGSLSRRGAWLASLPWPPIAPPPAPAVVDFVYGPLAGADFPTLAWSRAARQVERERPPRLAYTDPRGEPALRQALQAYLARARGIACTAEQLLVVAGSQQALDLSARLLVDAGDTVAVENPGYRMAHLVFELAGAQLHGVAVDRQGLRVDALDAAPAARLVFVTPTHQFPLGAHLGIARRRALLAWAAERGAWVVEDDYDAEYRYALRPEATLHALDGGRRVVHVGTFSKTLSPQLRLGYMVVPADLAPAFANAKRLMDRHAPSIPQRTLARLLDDGNYERHVRRMRRVQQVRRDALLAALQARLPGVVEVQGAASGLHLVAWFPALPSAREAALAAAARAAGVLVYPISAFYLPTTDTDTGTDAPMPARPAGLVMGYALLTPEQIDRGVERLAGVLQRLLRA